MSGTMLGGGWYPEEAAGPAANLEPNGGAGVNANMVDAGTADNPGKVHTDDLGDIIKDFADYPPKEPFCLLPVGYQDTPSVTNTKDEKLFFPGLQNVYPSHKGDLNTVGPLYPCVPSNSKQAAVTGSFAVGSMTSMFASSPLFSKVVIPKGKPDFGYGPSMP